MEAILKQAKEIFDKMPEVKEVVVNVEGTKLVIKREE